MRTGEEATSSFFFSSPSCWMLSMPLCATKRLIYCPSLCAESAISLNEGLTNRDRVKGRKSQQNRKLLSSSIKAISFCGRPWSLMNGMAKSQQRFNEAANSWPSCNFIAKGIQKNKFQSNRSLVSGYLTCNFWIFNSVRGQVNLKKTCWEKWWNGMKQHLPLEHFSSSGFWSRLCGNKKSICTCLCLLHKET